MGLIAEEIRSVWPYAMSDLILKSLLTKTQDAGEDAYDFASAGQAIRSGPNRARKNVNFHGMGNYEDMDGDLDTIKLLKIPNFQGKNDPEAYLEWEKKVDWIFLLP